MPEIWQQSYFMNSFVRNDSRKFHSLFSSLVLRNYRNTIKCKNIMTKKKQVYPIVVSFWFGCTGILQIQFFVTLFQVAAISKNMHIFELMPDKMNIVQDPNFELSRKPPLIIKIWLKLKRCKNPSYVNFVAAWKHKVG